MNANQAKEAYSKINMAALPDELTSEIKQIKAGTNDFTGTDAESKAFYENMGALMEIVETAFPQAIKAIRTAPRKPAKAKKVARARVVRKTRKATAKKKAAAKPKAAPKPKSAPKPKVASKPKATPKPKAAPKPKRVTAKKVAKPKVDPEVKKREQLNAINAEIRKILAQLKDNDKVKMQVAKEAEKQYKEIVSLGRTTLDVNLEKAKIQLKLYKRFLATDKAKFKRIRTNAIGKVEADLGKPKTKKKPKKATKPRAKKSGIVKVLDRMERAIFGK